jgi:hypothetical protein
MWLRYIGKLHEWKYGRSLFRVCFWLSLLPTLEMIMINTPAWSAYMRLAHANLSIYSLVALFEVTALFAAVLLWLGMFVHCLGTPRTHSKKGIWAILFFLGIWWTAELYYLVSYIEWKKKSALTIGSLASCQQEEHR